MIILWLLEHAFLSLRNRKYLVIMYAIFSSLIYFHFLRKEKAEKSFSKIKQNYFRVCSVQYVLMKCHHENSFIKLVSLVTLSSESNRILGKIVDQWLTRTKIVDEKTASLSGCKWDAGPTKKNGMMCWRGGCWSGVSEPTIISLTICCCRPVGHVGPIPFPFS